METFRPNPEEYERLHDEANKFNEAIDNGAATPEELKEFLVDPEISPDLFVFNLRMKRYGDALLYLMSVPGTGCHMSHDKSMILETLNRGESISPFERTSDEFFMSFNVASTDGVAGSALEAPFSYQRYKGCDHVGLIIRPTYLEKMADFTENEEEITAALERYIEREKVAMPGDEWRFDEFGLLARQRLPNALLTARKLSQSIRAKDAGEDYENVEVQPNIGLRGATMKDGELVALPFTPEDIVCYFTIRQTGEKLLADASPLDYIQLYHPDGQLFTREEMNTLIRKAKEEKVIERYDQYNQARSNITSLAS